MSTKCDRSGTVACGPLLTYGEDEKGKESYFTPEAMPEKVAGRADAKKDIDGNEDNVDDHARWNGHGFSKWMG